MEDKFLVKVHDSYRDVVAVCDADLIGKKIEEGEFQLDLTGEFYKGDEMNVDGLKRVIEAGGNEDSTFNIVGNNSVGVFLELGLVNKGGVREIGGVKFALVLV